MRKKISQVALVCFAVGVLLAGVGIGISMVEFSSLQYIGEKNLGSELQTKVFEETVTLENGKELLLRTRGDKSEVEFNEEIPEGIIRYEITYNPQVCDPELECYRGFDYEEYSIRMWRRENVGMIMQYKDEILKDLRNRKVASYQIRDDIHVLISCHPAMEEKYDLKIIQY